MKRKTTKEILVESLRELAEKKSISKITIKEITDNCDYSPATFYRQFRDKYDLMAWDYLRYLKENIFKVGKNGFTWKDAALCGALFHYENREYLENLIQNTSGQFSFELYMADATFDFIRQAVEAKHGKLDDLEQSVLKVYCYGAVKYNSDWILGKVEATPEEIAEIDTQSVPELFKKYFA